MTINSTFVDYVVQSENKRYSTVKRTFERIKIIRLNISVHLVWNATANDIVNYTDKPLEST